MDLKLLRKIHHPYYHIEVPYADAVGGYSNIDLLLHFIGENFLHGRNAIGNAYVELTRRTDQKLGISRWAFNHRRWRTSKKMIQSLRQYYSIPKNVNRVDVSIPYRMCCIVASIVDCVNELKAKGVPMPSNLISLSNKMYRDAFFSVQTDAYNGMYANNRDTWALTHHPARYLNDCFNANGSPMQKKF